MKSGALDYPVAKVKLAIGRTLAAPVDLALHAPR